MEPIIYVYKLVADNGGAPCVWRGVLSLALCKPKIRKTANVGAWIFGFGGKAYGERLLYIAEVTEKPPTGDYYRLLQFAGRPDCIYEDIDRKPRRKRQARYHVQSDERAKDVGMGFERADVLLSRNFRYLGDKGTAAYQHDGDFQTITHLIQNLKRGHRVNHSAELRREFLKLKNRIWRQYPSVMKVGSPSEQDCSRLCNMDVPSVQCQQHRND